MFFLIVSLSATTLQLCTGRTKMPSCLDSKNVSRACNFSSLFLGNVPSGESPVTVILSQQPG